MAQRSSSLRIRLLVLVVFALVPAMVLVVFTAWEQRRMTARDVQRHALQIVRLAAHHHEQRIEDTRQLLMGLVHTDEVRSRRGGDCHRFLSDLIQYYPLYGDFGVVGPSGGLLCHAAAAPDVPELAARAAIRRAIDTREFSVGSYQVRGEGRPLLDFGYPVVRSTGELEAVIYAQLGLPVLAELDAVVGLPEGSVLMIVDREGLILSPAPHGKRWVGRTGERFLVGTMAERGGEGVTETVDADGVTRLFAFAPLRGANGDLSLAIGVPKEHVLAGVNELLLRHVAGLALTGVVVLLAAWLGADLFVLRRVRALLQATRLVAAGDFAARRGLPHDPGELGQLSEAFDEMAVSLERVMTHNQRLYETKRAETEERAQAERALQESHALFQAVIQGTTDAVYVKDRHGRYLLINAAGAQYVGRSSDEVTGQCDAAIFSAEIAAHIVAHDRQVMAANRPQTFEEVQPVGDGARVFLSTKAPYRDHRGRVIGIIGVSRDITNRKRIEAQIQQSLSEKETLLKEIHHRVKNNLQLISSLLSLQAGDAPGDSSIGERLRESQDRIRSMALIHEKLYQSEDLARIDFDDYLRSLTAFLFRSYHTNERAVVLDITVDRVALGVDRAIPCGLVVNELVSNALKHAFPGRETGRITIDLHMGDGDPGRLTLTVADDGVGCPPGFHPTRSESLGFQLVTMLAEQMGGTLTFCSGSGTEVRLTFPVAESDDHARNQTKHLTALQV